ncbi:MAG: aminotransferase class I/II-fold pyridoxal phosphate-dependent enzyme [Armatimonadota bacterium]|nr:aminotransferase class I/II-fold pyridoxal phosphate-dependent enzyme [Armatimonadota bacterium]
MAQAFAPFMLERFQSLHEHDVEYNLTESGVAPLSLRELIAGDPAFIEQLLQTELGYPHVNGIPALRANVAALYPGADADNVLITVGAAEANYVATQTLLAPGDEVVVMIPNYLQIWGTARNLGCVVKTFHLRADARWAVDLGQLDDAVTERTKLIALCNPNNPTGHVLTEPEMTAIVDAAARVGAWILSDESYRGAERETDALTPSCYGRYDRVVAVSSLSKAYGLPGLRIGWVVAPAGMLDAIWDRHHYTTISASMLSNHLGAIALRPAVRDRLLRRGRDGIRRSYRVLQEWMDSHADVFAVVPPAAAAIAFVRYHLDVNSSQLADRLRRETSVLVAPGDHFGVDGYLRIGFGAPPERLVPALTRISEFIRR